MNLQLHVKRSVIAVACSGIRRGWGRTSERLFFLNLKFFFFFQVLWGHQREWRKIVKAGLADTRHAMEGVVYKPGGFND